MTQSSSAGRSPSRAARASAAITPSAVSSSAGREKQEGPQLLLGCRDVFAAGERRVEVEGPALEDEAEAVLREAAA